jgi:HSP20 family protein
VRRNPFKEIEEMLERMSKQVEGGVVGFELGSIQVDVRDEGDRYVVLADLPGFEAEDVDLRLSGRRLEIDAEREDTVDVEDTDYVKRERTRTSAKRSIRLPEEVDESEVSASLDEGVLTVTLPKRRSDERQHIEIED